MTAPDLKEAVARVIAVAAFSEGSASAQQIAARLLSPEGPIGHRIAELERANTELVAKVSEHAAARGEAERMRERCAKAVLGAIFGMPSNWPGEFPRGWVQPNSWPADRAPTPTEAAMHDNGCMDAYRAIRALPLSPEPNGERDA